MVNGNSISTDIFKRKETTFECDYKCTENKLNHVGSNYTCTIP